jgi:hypothetical protein
LQASLAVASPQRVVPQVRNWHNPDLPECLLFGRSQGKADIKQTSLSSSVFQYAPQIHVTLGCADQAFVAIRAMALNAASSGSISVVYGHRILGTNEGRPLTASTPRPAAAEKEAVIA